MNGLDLGVPRRGVSQSVAESNPWGDSHVQCVLPKLATDARLLVATERHVLLHTVETIYLVESASQHRIMDADDSETHTKV